MSKEQTALERIKNEVAKEKGYDNWRHMEINWPTVVTDNIWPEVCERYARECCQATINEYREKLKISVARIHRINKKQFDRKDWENLEMTPATYQGSMNACEEILKLIDSIKNDTNSYTQWMD